MAGEIICISVPQSKFWGGILGYWPPCPMIYDHKVLLQFQARGRTRPSNLFVYILYYSFFVLLVNVSFAVLGLVSLVY